MDNFKTVNNDLDNLLGVEDMEYKAVFIDGVLHMIPVTLNHEVLDGIENRKINKAKGV